MNDTTVEFKRIPEQKPAVDLGDKPGSARRLNEWVTAHPTDARARVDMAWLAVASDKPEAANTWASDVVANYKDVTDSRAVAAANTVLGVVAVTNDDVTQAQEFFRLAYEGNPDHTIAKLFTTTEVSELETRLEENKRSSPTPAQELDKMMLELALKYKKATQPTQEAAVQIQPQPDLTQITIAPSPLLEQYQNPPINNSFVAQPPLLQNHSSTDTVTMPEDADTPVPTELPTPEPIVQNGEFTHEELADRMQKLIPLEKETYEKLKTETLHKTSDEIDAILAKVPEYVPATIILETKAKVTQVLNHPLAKLNPAMVEASEKWIKKLEDFQKISNPDFYLTFYKIDNENYGLVPRVRPKNDNAGLESTPQPDAQPTSWRWFRRLVGKDGTTQPTDEKTRKEKPLRKDERELVSWVTDTLANAAYDPDLKTRKERALEPQPA